jgi:hypothetical protein
MLSCLIICIKKGIQDEDVQIEKHLEVFVTALMNMGSLHLLL